LQKLERLWRRLSSLKVDRGTINLIGSDNKKNKQRLKRGFVGQIAKIIFGTLDSLDAEY